MLIDNLESAYSYLCQGGETLKILINFYKIYKRYHEDMAVALSDLTYDLITSEQIKSLSSSISSTSAFIKIQSNRHLETSQSIQSQILDPLQTFSENFNSSIYESIKSTKDSFFQLEEIRDIMRQNRQNYLQASVRAEKAERILHIEDEEDRLDLAKQNAEEMRNIATRASEEYFSSVAEEKQAWGDCEECRFFCINSLKESEESRIQFIKKIMQKHLKFEENFHTNMLETLKTPAEEIELINHSLEGKEFYQKYLEFASVEREEWVDYELWKKDMKDQGNDPISIEDGWISKKVAYVPMEPYLEQIKTVVYALLPMKQKEIDKKLVISEQEILNLLSILENVNTWPAFFEAVDYRKYILSIDYKNLQNLSRLFIKILTILEQDDTSNYHVFYKVITISHEIYSVTAQKIYLFKLINSHQIFQSQVFWKKTIETVISERVVSEKNIFKRNLEKLKKIKAKSNNPGKFEQKVAEKNSAVMYLSQFNFYMMNLKLDIQTALTVVKECSLKAELEPHKYSNIIVELHTLNPNYKFDKSSRIKSLRKSSKIRGRWGSYLYLGLSLKFLSRSEIKELFCVCKTWNSILMPWHYEKELLHYKNFKKRKEVWRTILNRPVKKSYKEIVRELKKNSSSIKQFEDVIAMDVLRSYNNKGLVDLDSVKEILKVYAFQNSKVGYCQGMNYLAGTLYYVFKNREQSFWAMTEMIRLNSMADMYSEELPKLKYLFFALDKMIALHLPDVFETLTSETITSNAFSSPWFLTLFGSLLFQYLDLQLEIWDLFIYRGWKIIFKVALLILKRLKPQIITKKYEDIMCLLTSVQSSPHMNIFENSFMRDLKEIKITNRMLSQIRRDYDKIKSK